jgi:hypothetical protein
VSANVGSQNYKKMNLLKQKNNSKKLIQANSNENEEKRSIEKPSDMDAGVVVPSLVRAKRIFSVIQINHNQNQNEWKTSLEKPRDVDAPDAGVVEPSLS